jgi:preprotein translocase subunit YajC
MSQIIFFVLLFVIMWVVMIRPQQKRAKALRLRQSSLKKGDNVVTIGGMHATVNAISDSTVSLRLSEGVFVKYDKSSIANVLPKGGDKTENVEKSQK